ncbi:hypothetical protein LO772_30315 [Yinghuangia sp. ASG 101]|uniref:hypothetical protein n=1 Tax=Yinghuangia sp. ASG 101 TaxID=2896848 RepID=UPI001E350B61|nr:hypothetical protein [Yinghuangia sp. ASG 101]UGQ11056.1 hypothetical protein LO772_30315 [Yinghuangia sp. ASG 101]
MRIEIATVTASTALLPPLLIYTARADHEQFAGAGWLIMGIPAALFVFAAIGGMRYGVLLLSTRRSPVQLPWRLCSFLGWAEEAGLLRLSGSAYQFRHKELQDWLAAPANQV